MHQSGPYTALELSEPSGAVSRSGDADIWQRVDLEPGRDIRLVGYLTIVVVALGLGFLVGRVELVAFGAPFIVALLLTQERVTPIQVRLSVRLLSRRVVEGDTARGTFEISGPEGLAYDITLVCANDAEVVTPDFGALMWRLSTTEHGPQLFELVPARWGRFSITSARITARRPHSLLVWRATTPLTVALTALPTAPRLDRLLEPASSHATAGSHLDRRAIGGGMDFAELRPYQPGDLLRNLNRAATARLGKPYVNEHHPERSGDVVVLIDSYIDGGVRMSESARRALIVTARATWAIARTHLSSQDKVGIASVGRLPVWLPPGGGARTRHGILEALMKLSAVFDTRDYSSGTINANRVPPSALAILISPLWDTRTLGIVSQLRARGREVAVLQLKSQDLLPEVTDEADRLARRVFALRVDNRVRALQSIGIAVVEWTPEVSLGSAISAAASLQRRRRSGAAR